MNKASRILIVEDNDPERRAITQILKGEGFNVFSAEDADRALSYIEEGMDLVISDVRLGDVSGMDLLTHWKRKQPETQIILLTGYSSVGSAVDAMKAGAYDYLTKPVNPDELILLVRRAIESQNKEHEIDDLRRRLDQKFGLEKIIGQSRQMKDVFARVQRAAPVDSTVLILGESGTGKELVAQALHHNSPRKKGPFVAVNIAAVPSTLVESELFGHVRGAFTGATDRRMGRFEQADGGTLFVDEVGDFELPLQAKLLRVLETLTVTPVGGHEDRKVDVRVVAATSRDILKMVKEGTFREDLYYRLNVVQVLLPPLRARTDDIPILVEHFLKEIATTKHTAQHRISPEVMRAFNSYQWPGNVRELRNILESMMVLADGEVLTELDLPDQIRAGAPKESSAAELPDLTIDELERLAIFRSLEKCDGNRTHAAVKLGISVRTLQRKLKDYEARGLIASADSDVLTRA
jgi:DNA-binding NtrC family response regulator